MLLRDSQSPSFSLCGCCRLRENEARGKVMKLSLVVIIFSYGVLGDGGANISSHLGYRTMERKA